MDHCLSFTRGFFRRIPLIEIVRFYLVITDREGIKKLHETYFFEQEIIPHIFIYIFIFSINIFLLMMPFFAGDPANKYKPVERAV